MAFSSVATQIKDSLEANWGLASPAAADIHFDVGWFDSRADRPDRQIIVSHFASPSPRWFGPNYPDMNLKAFIPDRFHVNVWVRIPRGEDGATQEIEVWNMKNEVFRILNANRATYVDPLGLVIPLDYGTQLNEVDDNGVPRILRWMLTVQANVKL